MSPWCFRRLLQVCLGFSSKTIDGTLVIFDYIDFLSFPQRLLIKFAVVRGSALIHTIVSLKRLQSFPMVSVIVSWLRFENILSRFQPIVFERDKIISNLFKTWGCTNVLVLIFQCIRMVTLTFWSYYIVKSFSITPCSYSYSRWLHYLFWQHTHGIKLLSWREGDCKKVGIRLIVVSLVQWGRLQLATHEGLVAASLSDALVVGCCNPHDIWRVFVKIVPWPDSTWHWQVLPADQWHKYSCTYKELSTNDSGIHVFLIWHITVNRIKAIWPCHGFK